MAWNEVVMPGVATPMILLSTPVRNIPRAKEIVTRASFHPVRYREVSTSWEASSKYVLVNAIGVFSTEVLEQASSILIFDFGDGEADCNESKSLDTSFGVHPLIESAKTPCSAGL